MTDLGKLIFGLSIGSAVFVGFLIGVAPMPRKLRRAALIAGPVADLAVFAYLVHKEGPCVGECYDQVALGFFGLYAFFAWFAGAAVGFAIRKAFVALRKRAAHASVG